MSEHVVPGKHLPDCPSQQPAGVEVTPDAINLTITACTGCLPFDRHIEQQFDRLREVMSLTTEQAREAMERFKRFAEEWRP